jgi:phospholipase/carboxylesterase
LGCSDDDPHVPQERINDTEIVFEKLDANISKRIHKGMGHTINRNEIKITRGMMENVLNRKGSLLDAV